MTAKRISELPSLGSVAGTLVVPTSDGVTTSKMTVQQIKDSMESMDRLVNGSNQVVLGTDGILTLPFGSTINDTPNAPGSGNGKAVEIKPGGVSHGNQLLRIYPTVPSPDGNHLHLTSGDLSITDLFLGDDNQFVQIAVDGKVCIGTYGTAGHFWQFGTDGKLTFPDGATILNSGITAAPEQALNLYGGSAQEGQGKSIQLYGGNAGSTSTNSYDGGRVRIYAGQGVNGGAGGYVRLRTYDANNTNYNLKLDSDGVVYLPYGSQIDFNAPYSRFKDAQNTGVQLGSPDDQNYVNVDNTAVTIQVNSDGVTGPHTLPQHNWVFGTDGSLALPNSNRHSEIYNTNGGYQTIFETFAVKGQGQKLTLDYDDASVKIQSQLGTEWTFGDTGSLTLPNGSTIGAGNAVFGVPITTARGTILIGNSPEPGQPSHFHIMKAGQQNLDLFLGDDANYVKLPSTGGVEISSYDIIGGQQVWRFGTDGNLTVPGTIKSSTISQVGYQFVVQTGVGGATNNNGASGVNLDHSALVDLIQAGWTAQFANYGPVAVTIVFDYDGLKFIGMGNSVFSANFPITFTSPDYALAMILPLVVASGSSHWQFGTDGVLTLPQVPPNYGNRNLSFIDAPVDADLRLRTYGNGHASLRVISNTSNGTRTLIDLDLDRVRISTNNDEADVGGTKDWLFGADGSLLFPDTGLIDDNGGIFRVKSNANAVQLGSSDDQNYVTVTTSNVVIQTLADTNNYNWQFGTDGSLALPQGSTITDNRSFNNFTAGTNYTSGSWGGDAVGVVNASTSLQHELSLLESGDFISITTVRTGTISTTVNGLYTGGPSGSLTVAVSTGSGDSITSITLLDRTASGIELTTHNNTWTFGTYGSLLIPAGNADNTAQGQILSDNESSFINLDVQFSSDIIGGMRLGTGGPKPVDIVTNTSNSNHKWRFGADGALTLPHGAGFGLGDSGQLKVNDTTTQSLDFRDASGRGFYTNGDGFSLRGNGSNTWQFGTTGSITFPQGGTLRVGTVPAHSTGATGDKAGTVAFDNDYIYYCLVDYEPTQYPALAALSGANGVDNGYLVPNSYQLPFVGWIIYYNNQTAVINQVINGGNPGYYTVFTATPLFIPADSIFLYGPPSADIWKRTAHGTGTW